MKYLILILLNLTILTGSYSQSIAGYFGGFANYFIPTSNIDKYKPTSLSRSGYNFKNNTYYFSLDLDDTYNKNDPVRKYSKDYGYEEYGTFKIEKSAGLTYLLFKSNNGFTYKERLGAFFNEGRLFLYDKDILFFMPEEDLRFEGLMPKVKGVSSSSFLKEREKEYNGTAFIEEKSSNIIPWVEGKKEDGIGEWVELDVRVIGSAAPSKRLTMTKLLFLNGYVSFTNPSLFLKNNRAKKVRIQIEKEKIDFTVDLKDSTELQTVKLPKVVRNDCKVRVTILEVYKGTTYSDTCISLIYPDGEDPYEVE